MKKFFLSLWLGFSRNPLQQKGATMIEYALIAGLISVAAVTLFSDIGDQVYAVFEDILDDLTD